MQAKRIAHRDLDLVKAMFLRINRICIAALFCSPGTGFAQEFSSAHIGSAKQEFMDRLELPALQDGANLIVRCVGRSSRRGALTQILCYDNPEDSENARLTGNAIRSAIRGLNLEPAMVDGQTKTVGYSFAIAFRQTGETQQVQLLENHLYNAQEFGGDYISAQKYDARNWRCTNQSEFPVLVEARVTHTGEIEDISLSNDSAESQCASAIRRAVTRAKYIPAHVDGQPIDSTYIEIYWGS